MSRLEKTFANLAKKREPALVIYLCAGDPDLATSYELFCAAARGGANILEIGVPFSDPAADGPIIQAASQRAIASGTTLDGIIEMVAKLEKEVNTPTILFSYYNPLLRYGLKNLCRKYKAAGGDGILVVDLPPEESQDLRKHTDHYGLNLIRLITPTTENRRIKKIVRGASGFLYLVGRTGVTGGKMGEIASVKKHMKRIRNITDLPTVVGFGISTPSDAEAMRKVGNGIVVGSAAVQLAADHNDHPDRNLQLQAFIASLKGSLLIGRPRKKHH